MGKPWHTLSAGEVAQALGVDGARGLADKEWKRRLRRFGPNKLEESKRTGPAALFFKQFRDFMVLVLIGAAAVSAALNEIIDSFAIMAIVVVNAVLGFIQEYKAERSLLLLKEMTAPTTTVRRGGEPGQVAAAEVVPGDILLLKEGDRVPADARLLSESALSADEAPLTGESVPVRKDARWVGPENTEPPDRRNTVYMGTTISRGRCEAVVVATGMDTQIGDIAALIKDVTAEVTPLQRRLEQLGRWLVAGCLLIVGIVFATGVTRGLPVYDMFLTGVSLAVAAIPEGLPAVVTVALAIGVQRMIKRNAIIRRLPAVETLGCATVICSDKTGTLTKNEMTVTSLVLADREIEVTGSGYEPRGQFHSGGRPIGPEDPDLRQALFICAGCNHAALVEQKKGNGKKGRLRRRRGWRIVGDPTEGALLVCARKGGENFRRDRHGYHPIGEIPFDSDRKRMSVLVERDGVLLSLVKGAPDVILDRCAQVQREGRIGEMSSRDRRRFKEKAEKLAGKALRVLALAYVRVDRGSLGQGGSERDELPESVVESNLVFVGLAAMMDPPRQEVGRAVTLARRAGIETIMVTGDHPRTAETIARGLGFGRTQAVTGQMVDQMDDEALAATVSKSRVFARVSPRHKLRIVRALKSLGHVVAMTGDGVNDAPAVKEADIGVAMGESGTDVTKEASAMILADDNYATLVAAIEEGRGIYDNVRKFIRYLLACNTGEVLAMFFGTFLGMPLPLLPIQILWVNLVTDGLPAIALGVDPTGPDVMARPPRRPSEGIFAQGLHVKIAVRGILIAICTVSAFAAGTFLGAAEGGDSVAYSRTLAFSTLVTAQLIYVFQCRSEKRTLLEIGLWGNKWLLLAVFTSFVMQCAVLYWEPAAAVFRTVPLSLRDWGLVFLLSGWSQILETALVGVRRTYLKRISVLRV